MNEAPPLTNRIDEYKALRENGAFSLASFNPGVNPDFVDDLVTEIESLRAQVAAWQDNYNEAKASEVELLRQIELAKQFFGLNNWEWDGANDSVTHPPESDQNGKNRPT